MAGIQSATPGLSPRSIGITRMGEEETEDASEPCWSSRGRGSNEGTGFRRGAMTLLAGETTRETAVEVGS